MSKEDMCIIEGKDWSYEVYNYKKFKKVMNNIKKSLDTQKEVYGILDDDFLDDVGNRMMDDVIEFLEDMYQDEDIIHWFIFDTVFGTKGGCCINIEEGFDHKCFNIHNIFHLYNYLISNLKKKGEDEGNNGDIKNIFNDFLKENGCYLQFYQNCVTDGICIRKFFKGYEGIEWALTDAFKWDKSPEGEVFWHNLHISWLNKLKDIGYHE